MAFPTSIELASFFGIPYNNLSTTLSQLAGISDATLYVASTTNFDAIGEVTIEDEVIYHTGKTAGSFTGCTRAYGNTTAAEHAAGKQVSLTFTATMWANMVQEVRAIMTALGASLANVASLTNTVTLTNKRITRRVYSTTSLATLTPEISTYDEFALTTLAEPLTIANHSTSTPANGDKMLITITPDATPRALTFGTAYVAKAGTALPTTTTASKTLVMGFRWDAGLGKWNLLASGVEA